MCVAVHVIFSKESALKAKIVSKIIVCNFIVHTLNHNK